MNRRGFISGLAALIGGVALEQAIPLGRVWSFPSKIVVVPPLAFHRDAFAMAFRAPLTRVDVMYGFGVLAEDADNCLAKPCG